MFRLIDFIYTLSCNILGIFIVIILIGTLASVLSHLN